MFYSGPQTAEILQWYCWIGGSGHSGWQESGHEGLKETEEKSSMRKKTFLKRFPFRAKAAVVNIIIP